MTDNMDCATLMIGVFAIFAAIQAELTIQPDVFATLAHSLGAGV
jgi:hypothetical protein